MSYTLQNSINFARTFIQYSPLTAGSGMEPAVSIATIIRNTLMNAPLTWYWNRAETTFPTVVGTQDYTIATILDLSFLESVSLTDDQGNIFEVKDLYNTTSLGVSAFQQRPTAIAVQSSDPVAGCKFRFLGVPDKIYTVTITYQKLAPQFGPFLITAVGNASAGNTTYTGNFNPSSFPAGSQVVITGPSGSNPVNNGAFAFVSGTATTLVLVNPAGVAALPSLALTQVTVVGVTTTYTGTITGGATNAYAGQVLTISGFANSGNNVVFTVTASTVTTLVGTTTTQVNESHAAATAPTQTLYAVNMSWAPIPDQFSDIYNNLFLSEAMAVVDDSRSQMYRQRGVAAFMATATGLTDMQKNAFTQQWLARDVDRQVSVGSTQLGNTSRGI
jgi:hypothetical protein